MNSSRGFTLIEILIVVAIIGVLAAAFLPRILGARETADSLAEQKTLSWHYENVQEYHRRHKTYPRGDGPRWIIDPWIRGIVTHTLENLDRYFTPGRPGGAYKELRDIVAKDPHAIWQSPDEINSFDTDFAGPGPDLARGMRRLAEDMPLMATDNEGAKPTYESGQINVLLGGGNVRTLQVDPDFLEFGWKVEEQGDRAMPVGPDSPHPLLQQLSIH